MTLLNEFESELQGNWVFEHGQFVEDATAKRIADLVSSALTKVGVSIDGWRILYVDSADGRYWELSYPNGNWQGGGPPRLLNVPQEYVRTEYAEQTG